MKQNEIVSMKLVIVGDGAVGKTCVLERYGSNNFNPQHVATVFENSICKVPFQNKMIHLGLWDTAGQEQYTKLRALAYNKADVLLIAFSVVDKSSFENALSTWYPEVEKSCQNAIKIFIGNKTDLRVLSNPDHVKEEFARKKVVALGCEYQECSALDGTGVKEIFAKAMMKYIEKTGKLAKPRKCQLI